MNDDRRDVLRRLEEWKQRIDELQRMYDSNGDFHGNRQSAARRYKALKEDLRVERLRIRNSRREPSTDSEIRWYDTTVGRAATKPAARWNQHPRLWRDFLNEAGTELWMAISRLKKNLAESPFGK